MSSLKLSYGAVFEFDELMREFLNVSQFPTESVTNYVVSLEKAFALLRDNYPKELEMEDKTQHLRERFYYGLKLEIHQRLTPSYEDGRITNVALVKKARELEYEYCPMEGVARGATDDPHMKDVMKTLREVKDQMQQMEDREARPKKKWKGKYGCYCCGEPGHWRRTCSQRPPRKKGTLTARRSSTPPDTSEEESTTSEEESKPTSATEKKNAKKAKPASRPQYYNSDPMARMFGRANKATVEVNGVPTTWWTQELQLPSSMQTSVNNKGWKSTL